MARVHVTRRLPARVEDELASSFELTREPDGVDGLLVTPGDPVDAALLDRAGPSLRVVANFGVGYDNVDLAAATQRRVVVANTPDVLTEATAELTIALLLALLRRVAEGDRLVRRVRDDDAALGRGREVDVVVAHAEVRDDPQRRPGPVEQRRVDRVARVHEEAVHALGLGRELERGGELVLDAGREPPRHVDAGH